MLNSNNFLLSKKYIYNKAQMLQKTGFYDAYDTAEFKLIHNSKWQKGLIYLGVNFMPHFVYKYNIARTYEWDENIQLLGNMAIDLGLFEDAWNYYNKAIITSKERYYWGLPFDWKSGKYLFPKGTMMSTTTAEMGMFFLKFGRKLKIDNSVVLIKIANNLLNGLNRTINTNHELALSYTPIDEYQIINSNLLVACFLGNVGEYTNNSDLIDAARKLVRTCMKYIPNDGGIRYRFNDGPIDSYHQVFCIRSFYELKHIVPEAEDGFKLSLRYLKTNLMDEEGRVYLNPSKRIMDLQGSSEALGLFKLIGDDVSYEKTLNHIKLDFLYKGNLVQRVWIIKKRCILHSCVLFARQGLLRLGCALKT